MYLVVGATGMLGQEVCRQLRAAGRPVQALVRTNSDPAKVEHLAKLGVLPVYGDLKDRASLLCACRNITGVISTASSTFSRQAGDSIASVDHDGQLWLVDAAKAAGVKHFVFVSFPDSLEIQYPLTQAKRAVEQRLRASGMEYTSLQANCFMEIWLSAAVGFDYAHATATIYGDGHSKLSWISYRDVARFAVASLDNPAARNAVLAIGGPEALSPLEVVRIFEEVGGRPFTCQHVPIEALQEQKRQATDPIQESFAGLMLKVAHGLPMDMTPILRDFPMELISVRDYAHRVVQPEFQAMPA